MNKVKIAFLKTIKFDDRSTEHMALEVLDDPKYDDCKYVDKNEIEKAFDEYGYKLNPFNANTYSSIMLSPNIEGYFLKNNLPEIESLVFDDVCDEEYLKKVMDKHPDISHFALSTYAMGMDNTIKVIKTMKTEYPDVQIIIGGIGVLYPHLKKYVDEKNICYGNGVNWLRNYFKLKPYKKGEYNISIIPSKKGVYNIKTVYLVTQIGCPGNCDFCITNTFLNYTPLSNSSKKIIDSLEKIKNESNKDIFLFLCDPNALYPTNVWKEVFEYFITHNQGNYIYLLCLITLNHLQSFDLERIQQKSSLKLFMVNFGIESVLQGGYEKNKNIQNTYIKELNNLGISTFHNFILGLPYHTEKLIDLEIKRNFEFDSVWFSVNTLKPLPTTKIYSDLKKENRIFGDDLPPEFLYREGFFPFKHKYLGSGYSALKYAFKAYYECEKKSIDSYGRFIETLSKIPFSESSNFIRDLTITFKDLSRKNFELTKLRMPSSFIKKYEENYMRTFSSKI
ncbi:MAG: B12-binding domain-containing radical SAM protein [Promethearchaeota archaeon]